MNICSYFHSVIEIIELSRSRARHGIAKAQTISTFNEARLVPQALFCRWFQPTVLNTGGKASSSVGFIPFHNIISGKGLKPTEESGKTGMFIYPSVETQCHQFKKKYP
ncbi:hypothetical protein DXA15_22760 [Parabacteroides sp. AM58-2XD]|nr:hypothetical protein DXA15_22760 [Parabacteroides sp. AM58-2XD]